MAVFFFIAVRGVNGEYLLRLHTLQGTGRTAAREPGICFQQHEYAPRVPLRPADTAGD